MSTSSKQASLRRRRESPIRITGSDVEYLHFSCRSRSRKSVEHDLFICKRHFVVWCACEAANYHGRVNSLPPTFFGLMEGSEHPTCWHMRRLADECREILRKCQSTELSCRVALQPTLNFDRQIAGKALSNSPLPYKSESNRQTEALTQTSFV